MNIANCIYVQRVCKKCIYDKNDKITNSNKNDKITKPHKN